MTPDEVSAWYDAHPRDGAGTSGDTRGRGGLVGAP